MTSSESPILHASKHLHTLLTAHGPTSTLPSPSSITTASSSIHTTLPAQGLGFSPTASHLLHDLTPGLSGSSLSPAYYGFVTGGCTPIARLADQLVTSWDQNVSVHLPRESVATLVEDRALTMLCQLFGLPEDHFPARTLTTGATASNILGLASGRDFVLDWHARKAGKVYDPAVGLLGACREAGVTKLQILTTCPHSSLGKAASIVGLGSGSMVDVSADGAGGIRFDMGRLEKFLGEEGAASIVAVSCSEVNLGGFATAGLEDMQALRGLCDRYGAWLHVDAAFGLFASILPDAPAYTTLRAGTAGMHLADSITSDGHKLLNVPYDTGLFFSRHASVSAHVFSNPNAPYLRSTASDGIVSPLNLGLENSRRWRALPVYSNLLAYGRLGLAQMVERMVLLARAVARFILTDASWLEVVLPGDVDTDTDADVDREGNGDGKGDDDDDDDDDDVERKIEGIFMVVAFRARDRARNETLVQRIKDDRRIYVSGTVVRGIPAARIAVAKWDVDVQRDLDVVKGVLRDLA